MSNTTTTLQPVNENGTAALTIAELPDAGKDRFWYSEHNPRNVKFPLVLELRQSSITTGRPPRLGFSIVIARQPVIADAKAIVEAAADILVRASQADQYVGILTKGTA